jgi:hypothetical protein
MLKMRIGGRFLGILKHYGENHKIGFLRVKSEKGQALIIDI